MNKILKNSWALFLGMSLIMLAHGYQGSLLGVRAVREEFSLTATGFMLSGYYVGYFIGARTITNLISRVGHIRTFAAFASIASIVVLIILLYASYKVFLFHEENFNIQFWWRFRRLYSNHTFFT